MSLFQLKDNLVIINPEVLIIPEFNKLWTRDKSKNKESAFKELSFVYFVSDFNSPYSNYPEDKREQLIKDDFIKDRKWKPDAEINEAIQKYKSLSETATSRLLESVRGVINRMSKYLDNTDIGDETIRNILDTITKTTSVVASYAKLEEAVKKEQGMGSKARGNKEIGDYER